MYYIFYRIYFNFSLIPAPVCCLIKGAALINDSFIFYKTSTVIMIKLYKHNN